MVCLHHVSTPGLKDRFADIIVIINDVHTFHLEAQMTKDERIVLRVFEYEFFYAMSQWSDDNTLYFPELMIIYLDNQPGIPKESILHISFCNQGTFDYKVQNYMYLEHDVTELNRRKMIVLIPFQLLELTKLLYAHICVDLEKVGGCEEMKPLLDGAIELPNDKYRFRIDFISQTSATMLCHAPHATHAML